MADNEKFDIVKWVKGFIDPKTWAKSLVYGLMIAAIIFVGLTIYRAYFKKDQAQKTTIHIASGGTANITNVQNAEKKRKWWMPIPYISVFGEARNDTTSKFEDIKYGYGGQVGLRLDF